MEKMASRFTRLVYRGVLEEVSIEGAEKRLEDRKV
jgi:hypothetical protein